MSASGDEAGLFAHIRVMIDVILGLGVTTLLRGFAGIVEHPKRFGWSPIHLAWVAWTLVSVLTVWWWEFLLGGAPTTWTFGAYLFVTGYCSLYFLLAALLFPGDVSEYGSYEAYFVRRRGWFFGLIVAITLTDLGDTALKGAAHWQALGAAYPIHIVAMLSIAGLGIALPNKRAQLFIALGALAYQVGYFAMEYFRIATP
jgi:hypothetical protein